MPRLKTKTLEEVDGRILDYLAEKEKAIYTVHIANALNLDDEFVRKRLEVLLKKGLITEVDRSEDGKRINLIRRRWEIIE